MASTSHRHPASFRDPSGYIFTQNGVLYRQVNQAFRTHFDLLISSGLYANLAGQKLLIPHEIMPENLTGEQQWYITLKPEPIRFISYPWEWSFDMLKDAALLTLRILKEALAHGLILKDATPFNLQWHQGRLIFIDSLSFETYNEEEPWIAYRQYCEMFLSPLLLMHYKQLPLQQLLLAWPEGIPLAVTSKLLPWKSRLSLHTYLHIHLNAKITGRQKQPLKKKIKFSRPKLLNLVRSLETLTLKLKAPRGQSTWSGYYAEASARSSYLEEKKKIVSQWSGRFAAGTTITDFGANDGEFSKLLAAKKIEVIACDVDPTCINNLYMQIIASGESNIQPLLTDLANPSPGNGVNHTERLPLLQRLQNDAGIALALLHHLAIGRNIPIEMIAAMFHRTCRKFLIIEFVPKSDEKVQLLLAEKKDIYTDYTEEKFTNAFGAYFTVQEKQPVADSGRTLYLLVKNEG